ncbi:MAG TPA: hypothetical protein VGG94_07000 [Chthoniobacterales bacterium]
MLSREASTRAYQDYWVNMAEFWFKLARHAEEKEGAVAGHQDEADKAMFGGHGLLTARRSFSPIKDLKFLESVERIEPSYSARNSRSSS